MIKKVQGSWHKAQGFKSKYQYLTCRGEPACSPDFVFIQLDIFDLIERFT